MFILTYLMMDDTQEVEEEYETKQEALKAMNELMDGMVNHAQINDEEGNIIEER